jgi:hypothetical protein
VSGHVFISYRHIGPDADYVDRLAQFLMAAGISVWFDREMISGDRWEEVIREHIDTSAAVVVVMSPSAEDSPWVKREIGRAEAMNRPILPLLLAGSVFFRLSDLQYEDVSDGDLPPARFVARLAGLVGTRQVPAPELASAVPVPVPPSGAAPRPAAASEPVVGAEIGGGPGPVRTPMSRRAVLVSGLATAALAGGVYGLIRSGGAWHTSGAGNTPSAARLTTAGSTRNVSAPTNHLIAHFGERVPGGTLVNVAINSTGTMLAESHGLQAIYLWDLTTFRKLATLVTGSEISSSGGLAFSPDSRALAVGTFYDTQLWDLSTRRRVASLPHADETIGYGGSDVLAYSPDGQRLAVSAGTRTVTLFVVASGNAAATLTHPQPVASVRYSPDGKLLATACADHVIRLWSTASHQVVGELRGHTASVTAVAFSYDGSLLASCGEDSTLRLWELAGRTFIGTMSPTVYQPSLAFSRQGRLASATLDGELRVWNPLTRGLTDSVTDSADAYGRMDLAFTPNGRLATVGEGGVNLWAVS